MLNWDCVQCGREMHMKGRESLHKLSGRSECDPVDARMHVMRNVWELHYCTISASNDPNIGDGRSAIYQMSQGLTQMVIAETYGLTIGQARWVYERLFCESGEVLSIGAVHEALAEAEASRASS